MREVCRRAGVRVTAVDPPLTGIRVADDGTKSQRYVVSLHCVDPCACCGVTVALRDLGWIRVRAVAVTVALRDFGWILERAVAVIVALRGSRDAAVPLSRGFFPPHAQPR